MHALEDLIFRRDLPGIERFVAKGDFDLDQPISGDRPALALAAACDYGEVVSRLLDLGADIDRPNAGDLGYSPLEEAAREGSGEALRILLDRKADIDRGNTINCSPLIGACISANREIAEVLLDHGANVDHTDDNGQTALHYLCRHAKSWGGASITKTVDGVTTSVDNPRFAQHTAVFELLLERGASVDQLTGYGYSPLHLAADTNTATFIKPLVARGANVDAQNAKGYAPLHAACDRGHVEAATALIAARADVNVTDGDHFTPLLGATLAQNIDLVRALLEAGARPDVATTGAYQQVQVGDTPASLARRLDNDALFGLLDAQSSKP